MSRLVKILGLVGIGFVGLLLIIFLVRLWDTPSALLFRLQFSEKGKSRIMMRLNMARGDVTSALIKSFKNEDKRPAFRADVLDLLFKRFRRTADPTVESVLLESIKDSNPAVRRAAVLGFATYMDEKMQAAVIPLINDPDSLVQRQALLIIRGTGNLWTILSQEQRNQAVQFAHQSLAKMKPEEAQIAPVRAVVGREINFICDQAEQALQSSDVVRADSLLRAAIALDSTHNRPYMIQMYQFWKLGDPSKAIAVARDHGMLMEITNLGKPPVIDGDPTDPEWNRGFLRETFFDGSEPWFPKPAAGKARCMIGHCGGSIYVAVIGYEDNLDKVVIKNRARDGANWADDNIDMFFMTKPQGSTHQFMINAAGAVLDGARDSQAGSTKNYNCQAQSKIFKDRGYWAMEFSVPAKELDNASIGSGAVWSIMLNRNRVGTTSTQESLFPQNWSMYPLAIFK